MCGRYGEKSVVVDGIYFWCLFWLVIVVILDDIEVINLEVLSFKFMGDSDGVLKGLRNVFLWDCLFLIVDCFFGSGERLCLFLMMV